ncbi:MAG: glycogen debranching N-terminal domain-containing protein [Acidimicrobiia bacterium]|jgi:glycogen debranching enzyme
MTAVEPAHSDEQFQPPREGGLGLVTLVEGSTFCVAGRTADIDPGGAQGLFFLDTRLASRFQLRVDDQPVEPLSVQIEDPFSAIHVGRRWPVAGAADAQAVVTRHRYVGRGMREDVAIRNYGPHPDVIPVSLAVDVDFADLFAVKGGQPDPGRQRTAASGEEALRFETVGDDPHVEVSVRFDPAPDRIEPGLVSWQVRLGPGETWNMCAEVAAWLEGRAIELSHPCGTPVEHAIPAARLANWKDTTPRLTSDHAPLDQAVRRATEDLGVLRIFDPDHPDRVVVAAGAPWFMTLFGRDSLLTGWMSLLVDPSLALGVLQTLADLQGSEENTMTEEQPGRILHEVRFGRAASLAFRGGNVYYGSIDATPLFVMLLGELRRWGLADSTVEGLLPHVDRAMEWIDRYGDLDGDGYVEYRRTNPQGLEHQGWKDSWDGVCFRDGTLARSPIALCEVQGYVYAAYLARARFADEAGDRVTAERYRSRAATLKETFNRDFWSDEHGWYVMALDGEKRQVDALASNVGHCLWTGIVDEEKAAVVARQLISRDLFSGWGLRTLATSMAAYNPVSYHCGSVWPHDTAIAAAGLRRYGFIEESHRLVLGLLDLASTDYGRLPELVAGFPRDELREPVPYPTSCSPQAWAAAAPLLLLRSLIGLDPAMSLGRLYVEPVLPEEIGRIHLEGVPVDGSRLTIEVDGDDLTVEGAPDDIEVVVGQRRGEAADL